MAKQSDGPKLFIAFNDRRGFVIAQIETLHFHLS